MLLRERLPEALADDVPAEVEESRTRSGSDRWWPIAITVYFAAVVSGLVVLDQAQYGTMLALAAGLGVVLAVPAAKLLPVPALSTLVLWTVSALIALVIIFYGHADQEAISGALGLFVALTTPTIVFYVVQRLLWAKAPWRDVSSELTRVFTMPKSGVTAVVLGLSVGFPVIGTYVPLITDTDSGWLITSSLHLRQDGMSVLEETQNVFLPHLIYGPLLAVDGFRAAVLFSIGTTMALCGLTSYLGYKITGTGAGALVAALSLLALKGLPAASTLPMYPLMFFFGYGASWLLHRAMADPNRSKLLPVAAGIGFVLTYEAHAIGQLFLLVPLLLLLLHPWSRARLPLAITLVTGLVFSIPRILVNLAEGGTTAFRSNYTDYMTQKYLGIVNRDLWGQDVDAAPVEYLANVPRMTLNAVGSYGLLVLLLIPVLFAALRSRWRSSLFVVICAVLFIAALAVISPSTFARYLTPLGVGLALVAAVGVVAMLKESQTTTFGWLFAGGLLIMAVAQMTTMVNSVALVSRGVRTGPITQISEAIDDDRGVVGVRSPKLAWVDPNLRTENHRTMTEEDWLTYLVWPNDEAVAEVLDRYDIGWLVIIPNRPRDEPLGLTHEVDYHQTWITPTYGLQVNHVGGAMTSDMLCLSAASDGYLLYRYGSCEPGDIKDVPSGFPYGIYEPYRVRYLARDDLASEVIPSVGE